MNHLILAMITIAVFIVGLCQFNRRYKATNEKAVSASKNILYITVGAAANACYAVFLWVIEAEITADIIRLAVIASYLFFIALTDKTELVIPNVFIVTLLIMRVLLCAVDFYEQGGDLKFTLLSGVASALIGGLILFLPTLFSKNSVGMGDVKLVLAVGLFYDMSRMFMFLFVSFFLSSVVGIFMMVVKKKDRKTALPLAPFFFIGAAACAVLTF